MSADLLVFCFAPFECIYRFTIDSQLFSFWGLIVLLLLYFLDTWNWHSDLTF